MDELRIPEGINEEKLKRKLDALGNEREVSISSRWTFGVKGLRSVSLFQWIKEMFKKRKDG